ncbi:MAG: ABC transporter ATP-binding protein/permease [Chloroflexi bacterium]|nr:ABC transporter ATP-binding protein/permease [Chloroflexota bacterium]MBU1748621.1 ABC transporter ATP-binding protein/permease [Chloroflexota bacterium]MBU1877386.1 ABC transporter ATP-binding protein/permease [Chloroflexota bacterium]
MTSPAQHPGSLHILRRCYGYLRPYRRLAVPAYLALLVINALNALIPQIIREAVDRGMDGGDVAFLGAMVLALLALTLVKGVLAFIQGRWIEQSSQGVAYDLRNAIHGQLAALSFSYHDQAETGQLLSRSIQDVERIRFLTGRATFRLLDGSVLLVGTTVMLTWMNPRLAILALLMVPLLGLTTFNFARQFRPLSLAIQQQLAVLTTRLDQNLRGARIVKAFAQEDAEIARFDAENVHWFDLSARSARLQAVNAPLLTLIANAGLVFVIWYGGLLVIRSELTLGELVAFTTYLGLLAQPVRLMGMITPVLAMAVASGERIFEILDAQSEVRELPDAVPLPPVRGHVCLEHVSFAYFGRHRVLDDVTFEARPGQVIALLGATGSGKSTIINLIPRFYDPTGGRITIDGHDIRQVTLNSLRDQIGIVLQETTLFAATVRENIAFGCLDAAEEAIVEAAQAAQCHEFILDMPDGYDSHVGERGVTLSGGQKQRIAIARALLKDPRILILDDALSSVDTETEQRIQVALERLMEGRTSFVIAQRLSTLRRADLILVLEQGRIVARGTHADLLSTSGLYAEIYYRQLRPQEAR